MSAKKTADKRDKFVKQVFAKTNIYAFVDCLNLGPEILFGYLSYLKQLGVTEKLSSITLVAEQNTNVKLYEAGIKSVASKCKIDTKICKRENSKKSITDHVFVACVSSIASGGKAKSIAVMSGDTDFLFLKDTFSKCRFLFCGNTDEVTSHFATCSDYTRVCCISRMTSLESSRKLSTINLMEELNDIADNMKNNMQSSPETVYNALYNYVKADTKLGKQIAKIAQVTGYKKTELCRALIHSLSFQYDQNGKLKVNVIKDWKGIVVGK